MIKIERSGRGFSMYVHSRRHPHHLSVMDAIELRDTLTKAINDFDPAEAPMSLKEIPSEIMEIAKRVAEKHNMAVIDLFSRTRHWLEARAEVIAEVKLAMKPRGWNTENIGWMFSREGSTMRIHALKTRRGNKNGPRKNNRTNKQDVAADRHGPIGGLDGR